MSRNQAVPTVGAARLQGTSTADLRLGGIVDSAILARELFAHQGLVRRAAEGVGLLVVVEFAAVKQRAVSLVIDRPRHRHVRHDALGLTRFSLLAVRVTCVGHPVQRFRMAPSGLGWLWPTAG